MCRNKGFNGLRILAVIEFVRDRSAANTIQQDQAEFLCSANLWMLLVIMKNLNIFYWQNIRFFDRIREIVVNSVFSLGNMSSNTVDAP